MKRKVELTVFFLIIILCIGLYYYQFSKNEEIIDPNKILENSAQYANKLYLENLSNTQRAQLVKSFNNLLYERCKNWALNENCNVHFIYTYLRTRFVIVEIENAPIGWGNMNSIDNEIFNHKIVEIYLNLLKDYPTLREDDLNGYLVPLLIQMCNTHFFNGTDKFPTYWFSDQDKTYWAEKIILIDKKNWISTYMQISYMVECIKADTTKDLSQRLNMSLNKLNNMVCNILPAFNNIIREDPCKIHNYLRIKQFCSINITEEERASAENILLKDYESNHQKECKAMLKSIL
ncbi:MAG: hypothetical protein V1900_02655 [Candidatus Aenigmatarchaeota archaeon]